MRVRERERVVSGLRMKCREQATSKEEVTMYNSARQTKGEQGGMMGTWHGQGHTARGMYFLREPARAKSFQAKLKCIRS